MTSVLHALWIAVWVLVALAFFGVAFLGMVGLTRAGYRLATRRGWKEPRPTAFTMVTGLVALLGGWLIYVCWWPFARLLRPWPRLHVIGPIVGVIALLFAGGAALDALDPTTHPTWVNDTGRSVTISGCTDDPASFAPGDRSSGPYVSTTANSCYVNFDFGDKPNGCLMLPHHFDSRTVIRVGDYTPTRRDCP